MRGRHRNAAALAAVAWLLAGGPDAGAAQRADTCPVADRAGWLGIDEFDCNCMLTAPRVARTTQRGAGATWQFRSEPVVGTIADDSPAAGVLRRGDVIVAVDGHPITTAEGGRRFGTLSPDRPVTLTIRRDGRRSTVRLTPLGLCPTDARLARQAVPRAPAPARARPPARPTPAPVPEPPAPVVPTPPPGELRPAGHLGLGYLCSDCGWERDRDGSRWQFSAPPQVWSVEPGSPAARAGLRRGDVITHVDGVSITTPSGARLFATTRPDETVNYTIRRGGSVSRVTLRAADRTPAADDDVTTRELRRTVERISRLREVNELRRELVALTRRLEQAERAETPSPPARAAVAEGTLRYSGTVGDADVEVRGSNAVITTIIEPGRDLLIITDGARIRIRVPEPRERR